ncbi:ATP-binding protein [Pseudomarimonas arenosa]|uniref:histidine kinase n=1 Tax=Pseudomarimonas arenosa TaxID=2774145 RepID=A0AAW3ZNF3_9GAMM|nr:ATP-binding protein [Pseudomarimonas arenosa]MBD8526607.1 sensor histidine kinase N-terminal domain-containing protein [Pseudomarimonas arenosa]
MNSLSRWLLIGILCALLLSGLISGYAAYRSGQIEAGELFDAKLAHSARVLLSLIDQRLAEGDPPTQPIVVDVWSGHAEGRGGDLATTEGHAYETKLAFQVWSAQRQLLLRSHSAPEQPLGPVTPGFHSVQLDDGQWRSFALQAASGRWYVTGERDDARREIAEEIAAGLLLPLLLQIPLLGLFIGWLIGVGERSLRRVVAEVEVRAADRLQPLEIGKVPSEIAPLVSSINRLLGGLRGALERERRFTADAAHELRTPLAALQVHLDNMRNADSTSARDESVERLQQSVHRMRRMVEQLLELARLEPEHIREGVESIDMAGLAREVMAELAATKSGCAHNMELREEDGLPRVSGWSASIEILLRNLVDNALRFSPPGSDVRVSLAQRDSRLVLTVEDGGPGLEQHAHQRVLQRFHRELGTGVEGSGLGLSIVSQVVSLHGATLQLERSVDLGGLSVSVSFPLHRSDQQLARLPNSNGTLQGF